MTTFYITLQCRRTGIRYTQPVPAKTMAEAKEKVLAWPYNNGDFIVKS